MPLFDSDFLAKLEYLSLVSRRTFRGQLLAQRRTAKLGSGVEFSDHREYNPGDDFRYLDWNLYARHDELLLKRFQEEEDLHVYLLLDVSRSMEFGEPPKFDLARKLVAALAYIALADLDRIAVVAFADRVVADFPLTRGKAKILALLDFLGRLEPAAAATNLAQVAAGFVHRSQRRGLAIVVSDLYDPDGYERGLDLLRHHRYELSVIQIHDRAEAEPKFLGDVELWDVETGAARKVTVTEKNLRQYKSLFASFQQNLKRYCRGHSVGCTLAASDLAFEELILGMMRAAGPVR